MTQTETQRKTGIEYFIQLVPFEDGRSIIGDTRFASEIILPENQKITPSADDSYFAIEAAQSYARRGESPRVVDITKYENGKLEIDVRQEE